MNIAVFCSSSPNVGEIYKKEAERLGLLIAKRNHWLVYGGNTLGLMGVIANTVHVNKSKIIGIIPRQIHNAGVTYKKLDKLIVTKNIRERKKLLSEYSDAFIALPGSFGTLEEITEVINDKLLGNQDKPIVFVNTANFYKDLFNYFEHSQKEGFLRSENTAVFYIAKNAQDAIKYIENYRSQNANPIY